ncbi:uncharacterized protein LOC107367047 isoform X4 [Tetranychus urticae]|uniref:uncharacterized protein LOC107367047 isoform X4 n=1 Tax=Tetranychus urticae TaxID=32264 RepID=UPI000D64FB9E|nr:uncharacterized protein LOC107367047 isoform X4 [Tetranychus urticae]
MKLSIVLIAIFFVSTISAAPVEEPSVFREGINNYILNAVKFWESIIPAWDPEASLESNVLAFVFGPTGPGWDSDLSTEKNVDNIINTIGIADTNQTTGEVVANVVNAFMLPLPLSSFFPKEEIGQQIIDDIFEKFFPDVSQRQTIGDDVKEWIDSHDDLKGLDGEDFIVNFLFKIFSHLNVSDVGPSNTLEEIAVRLADQLFDTVYPNN